MKKPTKAMLKKKERRRLKTEKKKLRLQKKREIRQAKTIFNKEAKAKHEAWANAIRARDGYICVICGKQFGNSSLQPHHILPKEYYPELQYDIMNGLAVAFNHHKIGKGSPHMDAIAFYNWLKKHRPEQLAYLEKFIEA